MKTVNAAIVTAIDRIGYGIYELGTGDCDTPRNGKSDCFGFAFNACYNIRRHRPGFNKGPWASVEDDLNCNSAIEDAQHNKDLFEEVASMQLIEPGDLLAYPSFHLKDSQGQDHSFIGHICIITERPYGPLQGYSDLMVVQCAGPNGRSPGILETSGLHWDQHDHTWPLPQHRTHILRPIQGRA